jgi:hypothetical protein
LQTYNKINKISGFERGKPFEFFIIVIDNSNNKTDGKAIYNSYINGNFIGKFIGKLPLWTINWIRVYLFNFLIF